MELKRLPIVFNQEEHTYTNSETGQLLKGITGTLVRRLYPNKYDGVPESVMKKAAERGSMIHAEIELADTMGIVPVSIEAQNYLRIKEEQEWKHLASEYTVSDLEHYATNIDVVYEVDDKTVDIGDFKTTYKMDEESTGWQLSICAYFFERVNPGIKVRRLLGIWLRDDKSKVYELERHGDEEIESLIADDLSGAEVEVEEKASAVPPYISENESTLVYLAEMIRKYQEQYDALKAEIMEKMERDGLKSVDSGAVLITYVQPTSRTSFDSKRFREEEPDLYESYVKRTQTSASLKVTMRE